jgi:hypothetical protein
VFLNDYSRGWRKILYNYSSKNNNNNNNNNNLLMRFTRRRRLLLADEISEGVVRNYNELFIFD